METSSALTARQQLVLGNLIQCYQLLGRNISERVLYSAAISISNALRCKDEEITKVFEKAKLLSDIPTIRVLSDAEKAIFDNRRNTTPRIQNLTSSYCYDKRKNLEKAKELLEIGTRIRKAERNLDAMLEECYDTKLCVDLSFDTAALERMKLYCRRFCEARR